MFLVFKDWVLHQGTLLFLRFSSFFDISSLGWFWMTLPRLLFIQNIVWNVLGEPIFWVEDVIHFYADGRPFGPVDAKAFALAIVPNRTSIPSGCEGQVSPPWGLCRTRQRQILGYRQGKVSSR